MVTRVTIDYIQIVQLIEMMFGSIRCIYTGYTRIKSATQDCSYAFLFKLVVISPLPAIFKFSLIFWFIVCRVEVVNTCLQTGVHYWQVLVGQCYIDNQFRTEAVDEVYDLCCIVGIYLCGFYAPPSHFLSNFFAFRESPAGKENFRKHIRVGGTFCSYYTADSPGSDN